MMDTALVDRCRSYVLAQKKQPRQHGGAVVHAVTISRETGAGAVAIGELVAARLEEREGRTGRPWAVFDRNLVEIVLAEHALPKRVGAYMPEDSTHELSSAFEEFLGVHPPTWTLLEHTNGTIVRLATAGNAIIVGRGANLITAGLRHVLHVRLVADLADRIKNLQQQHHLEKAAAVALLRKTDRARQRYVKSHFDASIDDPLHYHLVINTSRLGFDETAAIIAEATLRLGA